MLYSLKREENSNVCNVVVKSVTYYAMSYKSVTDGQKLHDSTDMRYPKYHWYKQSIKWWLPGAEGKLMFNGYAMDMKDD